MFTLEDAEKDRRPAKMQGRVVSYEAPEPSNVAVTGANILAEAIRRQPRQRFDWPSLFFGSGNPDV